MRYINPRFTYLLTYFVRGCGLENNFARYVDRVNVFDEGGRTPSVAVLTTDRSTFGRRLGQFIALSVHICAQHAMRVRQRIARVHLRQLIPADTCRTAAFPLILVERCV